MPKMRPKTFLIRSSAPVRSRARVRATVVMFFTFWFQFFAAIIAAGFLYGAIYLLMQDKAEKHIHHVAAEKDTNLCLLYTSPSPRDMRRSRMPSSA